MKWLVVACVSCVCLGSALPAAAEEVLPPKVVHTSDGALGPRHRIPIVAALLSLTPVPVDFGNIYAENLPWAVVYSAAETAIGSALLWFSGNHPCRPDVGCPPLSTADANASIALAVGYAGVKLASGIHALRAADDFNRRERARWYPMLAPARGGAVVSIGGSF